MLDPHGSSLVHPLDHRGDEDPASEASALGTGDVGPAPPSWAPCRPAEVRHIRARGRPLVKQQMGRPLASRRRHRPELWCAYSVFGIYGHLPIVRSLVLIRMTLAVLVARAAAIADPTRLRMLLRLRSDALCVGQLARAVGASSAAVSYHVRLLLHCGLVVTERRGRKTLVRRRGPEWTALVRSLQPSRDHIGGGPVASASGPCWTTARLLLVREKSWRPVST